MAKVAKDKKAKEKKQFWSDELIKCTKENFGGLCPVYMKYGGDDKSSPTSTLGFGKDSYRLDKDSIPESERDKECFLFELNKQDDGKLKFYKAYSSVDEMIDDGWAID